MVHHYVPTIHPFHRHFVNFPAPRCCHACSKSGHIAAFGHSRPPHHPHPGVTPLQHWPQRPFFWEAGTLIGGPPPLSSYPSNVSLMCMCPPPSLARSRCIWTHPSIPAIPAPGAVWPTTGPKGHPSGWLVHPLSAHHHLPSPSGTLCMHAVGGITVCYGIHLRSLVSGVRAYHHDPITFLHIILYIKLGKNIGAGILDSQKCSKSHRSHLIKSG